MWVFGLGTAVYAQVYRYRRISNVAQRQQIKWAIFGLSVALLAFLGISMALFVFASAPTSPSTLVALLVGYALAHAALLLIPLSIGVAILRNRL